MKYSTTSPDSAANSKTAKSASSAYPTTLYSPTFSTHASKAASAKKKYYSHPTTHYNYKKYSKNEHTSASKKDHSPKASSANAQPTQHENTETHEEREDCWG